MTTHIKTDFHSLSPAELSQQADKVATGQEKDPARWTNMPVTSADLRAGSAGVVAADSQQEQAKQDAQAATRNLHNLEEQLIAQLQKTALRAESILADMKPQDIEPAIVALGFAPKGKPVHHKDLPQPKGFSVSVGDAHGEIDWHVHGHPHRKDVKGYRIEAGDPSKPESFKEVQFESASKGTLTGLPSGQSVALRAVLLGTDGRVSAPSNVVSIFVP